MRKAAITILALVLLAMGLHRAIALAWPLAIEASIEGQNSTTAEGRAALVRAAGAFRQIDQRFGNPDARLRSASLEMALALSNAVPATGPEVDHVKAAISDLMEALRRRPADARSWLELARAHLLNGDAPASLVALRMSLELGRFDPALNLRRAEIGLRLWLQLTADDQANVVEQIQFAWDQVPDEVVKLAARDDWFAGIIRAGLVEGARALDEFDRLLIRQKQVGALGT